MTARDRVVFDCNVYFQAIISPFGPAGRLFSFAAARRFDLFFSTYVLGELHELTADDRIRSKYQLTPEILEEFFSKLAMVAVHVESVPSVFAFPRDPDDAHCVDLAVAANAKLIVSRDKDLLSLANPSNPDGLDFRLRFPDLAILTPSELLALLGESGS